MDVILTILCREGVPILVRTEREQLLPSSVPSNLVLRVLVIGDSFAVSPLVILSA